MIGRLLGRCLAAVGYELRRRQPEPGYASGPGREVDELIGLVRENTMTTREGLLSLYEQTLFCERKEIPGAFVECGVWKGGAAGLMALVNLRHGAERRPIHLFDAFDDICEPDAEVDGERAVREVGRWAKRGGTAGRLIPLRGFYDHRGGPGTLGDNRALLEERLGYDPGHLHYHQGWFQETLPAQHGQIQEIAVLRIDADWYASTRVCLEHLFGKVVSGGFVIIDDYGAYEGCRRAVDEFLAQLPQPLFLSAVTPDIRYIIAP